MRWVAGCLVALALLPVAAAADVGRARQEYVRIWKQDRRFLGASGKPPPLMAPIPRGQGYAQTVPGPNNVRTIELGPMIRKRLRSRKPRFYAQARWDLEHEFARIFQPDKVFLDPSPNAGAGVANALANRLAYRRNTGRGDVKRYARRHLPYYGQNPRTILWPLR